MRGPHKGRIETWRRVHTSDGPPRPRAESPAMAAATTRLENDVLYSRNKSSCCRRPPKQHHVEQAANLLAIDKVQRPRDATEPLP